MNFVQKAMAAGFTPDDKRFNGEGGFYGCDRADKPLYQWLRRGNKYILICLSGVYCPQPPLEQAGTFYTGPHGCFYIGLFEGEGAQQPIYQNWTQVPPPDELLNSWI
jgi:hypothetical protein